MPVVEIVPLVEPEPIVEETALPEPPPSLIYRWQLDARPTGEAHARRGNGVYRVGDREFQAWGYRDSYEVTGTASWRDDEFNDHETVTGELFDNSALQAAHKYLRIPSWVEVTNLLTDMKAVVRINDRGPFHGEYEIDLSRGAAEKIGVGPHKVVPVKIELLSAPRNYFVESNIVYGHDAAEDLLQKARELEGVQGRIVAHQYENRFRVRLGPLMSVEDSRMVQRWLLIKTATVSSVISE